MIISKSILHFWGKSLSLSLLCYWGQSSSQEQSLRNSDHQPCKISLLLQHSKRISLLLAPYPKASHSNSNLVSPARCPTLARKMWLELLLPANSCIWIRHICSNNVKTRTVLELTCQKCQSWQFWTAALMWRSRCYCNRNSYATYCQSTAHKYV